MGSMIVKIDDATESKLQNMHHYDDVDMLNFNKQRNDDIPMVYDVEAVKMSVRNILMWRVGESILRPEFGHNIHKSMYDQLDQFNKEKVSSEIQRAIEENEPRVKIHSVAVKNEIDDDENNLLKVQVTYSVYGNKTGEAKITQTTTVLGK